MKINITLQEKLRDLRDERKLKLQDVADGTKMIVKPCKRLYNSW